MATTGGDLYQDSTGAGLSASQGTLTLTGISPGTPRTRPFSLELNGASQHPDRSPDQQHVRAGQEGGLHPFVEGA